MAGKQQKVRPAEVPPKFADFPPGSRMLRLPKLNLPIYGGMALLQPQEGACTKARDCIRACISSLLAVASSQGDMLERMFRLTGERS